MRPPNRAHPNPLHAKDLALAVSGLDATVWQCPAGRSASTSRERARPTMRPQSALC
jgi:hypothetical protein